MRTFLYAGSFDPITIGHMSIIRRASALCDSLIVAVMVNPDKRYVFSVKQRMGMICHACQNLPNIKVLSHNGLLIDCAHENQVDAVIRGVRPLGDFESEFAMAQVNRMLGGVETLMLAADEQAAYISSSIVRQIAAFGGDISGMVPNGLEAEIQKAFVKN